MSEDLQQAEQKQGSGRYWSILAPFIPVLIVGMLKISLLDDVPTEDEARKAFLLAQYLKPLWLELVISGYILPVTAFMTNAVPSSRLRPLYIIPAIFIVACLVLVFGFPKFGFSGIFWQMTLPALLSAICILILGLILVWK